MPNISPPESSRSYPVVGIVDSGVSIVPSLAGVKPEAAAAFCDVSSAKNERVRISATTQESFSWLRPLTGAGPLLQVGAYAKGTQGRKPGRTAAADVFLDWLARVQGASEKDQKPLSPEGIAKLVLARLSEPGPLGIRYNLPMAYSKPRGIYALCTVVVACNLDACECGCLQMQRR